MSRSISPLTPYLTNGTDVTEHALGPRREQLGRTMRKPFMHGICNKSMVTTLAETATVTSKSMVTIPSSIRRKYGIKEGDKVQFVELEGTVMMIPVKSLAEMHGMFRDHAKSLIEGVRELNREHRKEARE